MEVAMHFVFEVIKIAILASIYAAIVLLIFSKIGNANPDSWFKRVTEKKKRFWFINALLISVGLFTFMFTYWGDHGLGDGPRIPIGHGMRVENVNWTEYGYLEEIKTSDNKKIEMTMFRVENDKLVGNLDSWFYIYNNSYLMYDLESKELVEFKTKNYYDKFALKNELPLSNELLTFSENYSRRWGGWRFWLLP